MLLADTCRELHPAEERACFVENSGFPSQEHCWAGHIPGQCVGLAWQLPAHQMLLHGPGEGTVG